jgi:hypothetical protein
VICREWVGIFFIPLRNYLFFRRAVKVVTGIKSYGGEPDTITHTQEIKTKFMFTRSIPWSLQNAN